MFDSVGWGELLVLALAAMFIFGPERLPTVTKDAARAIRRLRLAVRDVRNQVDDSLGDDMGVLRDVDLRRYRPATFIRDQIFRDDDGPDSS